MIFLSWAAIRANVWRFLGVSTSIGLAYAAMLLAYSVATNVQAGSSRALEYVIDGHTVWISGPGLPALSHETGTLVQDTALPPATAARLSVTSRGRLMPIAVQQVHLPSGPATLFWDARRDPNLGAAVSDAIATSADRRAVTRLLPPGARIDRGAATLPGRSIIAPLAWGGEALRASPTWLVGNLPPADARSVAADAGLHLADDLRSRPGGPGTLYLLESSLSRFDPFSFRTKFAALQLNRVASSLLGWLARLIFAMGAVFAIASMVMRVDERRAEIAALAVLGYEPEFTIMMLIEATAMAILAIFIGGATAAALIIVVLPSADVLPSLAEAFGHSVFFTLIILFFGTLFSAQTVARRSALDLIRGKV